MGPNLCQTSESFPLRPCDDVGEYFYFALEQVRLQLRRPDILRRVRREIRFRYTRMSGEGTQIIERPPQVRDGATYIHKRPRGAKVRAQRGTAIHKACFGELI